ncbi:MAG: aminotransferase class IV, partial [Nitrospiraceae bacterium]
MWIFLNDKFVDRKEAVVSVFDHGYLYGDGIYETLRAYGGRIFMLQQHLARLQRSGRSIGLDLPMPEKDWPALL